MHRRFHRGAKDNGKWQHVPRTGVGSITCEEYQGWTIELTHRKVGATIRRDQFMATLRRDSPVYEEQLPGFSTKDAALVAARKRIDLLSAVRRPFSMPRHIHRARTQPKDS